MSVLFTIMKFVSITIQIHWIEGRLEDRFYAGNVEISFGGINYVFGDEKALFFFGKDIFFYAYQN